MQEHIAPEAKSRKKLGVEHRAWPGNIPRPRRARVAEKGLERWK